MTTTCSHVRAAPHIIADSDTIFWDRLAEMPWSEAEEECVRRREQVVARVADLNVERGRVKSQKERDRLGAAIFADAAQLTALNERIKALRKSQDRSSWAKAVTAIFGQEGFTACREWMAQTEWEIQRRERKSEAPAFPYTPAAASSASRTGWSAAPLSSPFNPT